MKFYVNEGCIGCGMCSGLCPKVFRMNANGTAEAVNQEVDAEVLADALEAMDRCPAGAIEEE